MNKKTVAVLGAGVSGLSVAYELTKRNFNVVVIEKKDCVGGLSATFSYKGHLIDYGPHNFHTHIPEVLNFVRNELGVQLKSMPLTSSKLYFMGKFVNYPLKINDAMRNLNLFVSMKCFAGYILSRIRLKFKRNKKEDSFEQWVKNRFGKYIYDLYFGPYVKKVWGISGSEIDAVVARKRIPEPSLFSLVVKTLTNRKIGQKHSEDLDAVESYYPPKGIGAISDRFNELILANGGKVELNSDLQSIAIDRKMNSKKVVRYKCAGNEKTLECDYIVSTIPINNLYSYIPAPDKKKVEDDIAVLSYRSIILLYMSIEIEKLFDAPWIYFNERDDPGLIFNRMYEVGNFSQEMISNKKGVVCLEITCYKGDSIWNSSDEELFNSCIAYLGKNNFLNRRQVSGIFTKRVEIAYPVFKKGYQPRLLRILRHLTEELGILSVGRQGLFSYANIDHCIDMGLKTGLLFDSGDIGSYPNFFKMYSKYLS